MKISDRPIIAVTMGDPAGIGPEVVLGALKSAAVYERCVPVVIGSADVLRRCMAECGIEGLTINPIGPMSPISPIGLMGQVDVLDVPVAGLENLEPGKVQAVAGRAADAYIRKACELGLRHEVDAIATAPINKESLRAADISGIGHTELLADYLNGPDPLTLFITGNMRIFFLSRHLSLKDAIGYITFDTVLDMIRRVNSAMRKMGFGSPSIAVAALNPHGSDGGQFGDEEARHISPAVEAAKGEGINAIGPVPADSVFHQALEGRYDCVISLYHDQGHIASKTRDFFRTVTATLGLPVLRTSVDHGTGFDIAWQGKADPISMETAILAACDLLRAG